MQKNNFKEINITYPYLRKSGGMERYVIDLIGGMAKLGVKVNVITMFVDPEIEYDNENVHFHIFKIPALINFKSLSVKVFEFFCMKKTSAKAPTISCCRYPGCAEVAISAGTHIANRILIGKKIYRPFDFLSIWQEKKHFTSSKHVVAHSKSIANELVDYYSVPEANISVLYPPSDSHIFNRKSSRQKYEYRSSLGIDQDDIALLFPSGNHFRKGGDIILAALEKCDPRLKLIVAGSRDIIHPRVINVGFIDDMPSLYSAVDATILASRYEPFGLVAVESVLCGTPAILSEHVAATEVLNDEMCFKFKLNEESLIHTLNKVVLLWDSNEYDEYKIRMPKPRVDSLEEHCISLLELAYADTKL